MRTRNQRPYAALAALVADRWATGAADTGPATDGWRVVPAASGGNGVVFRAEGHGQVCAAKVSPLDDRRRGAREHAALRLLHDTGVAVAPHPRALVTRPGGLPVTVLVSSWLEGTVLSPAVESDAGTVNRLVDLLADLHTRTRCAAGTVRPAVLGTCPAQVLDRIRWYAARAADPRIDALIERIAPEIANRARGVPLPALVHSDANLANVVATPNGPRMVDWENAGRGDPCFDLADLCVHPGGLGGRPDLWPDMVDRHAHRLGDPAAARRTWLYARLLTVFWAALSRAEADNPRPRFAGTRGYRAAGLAGQADRYTELAGTLPHRP